MKITFFIGLFTICVLTCNAQNFKETKLSDSFIGKKALTFNKGFALDSFTNSVSFSSYKKSAENDSLFIYNFSQIKIQKNPKLYFPKRDLLLRDTDAPVKFIH